MKKFYTINNEERKAIDVVLDNDGPLSGYIGSNPIGGIECFNLENEWARTFKSRNAIAVNSATSGLLAACMAVGIGHGDEVIVSPYTMSATAAAPKILGARVVFADIEPETFTIDPVEVSNAITGKTRAVIATNLFGHPAHLHELRDICYNHGIYLIEDNAQAIFAKENDAYAGTIGHIGVFSLNVHKHLQVGEGGICVTNSSGLAMKLREAMNHGEMRGGILGLNLRMTEVTAAMARVQLSKANEIIPRRIEIAEAITSCVKVLKLPIKCPEIRQGCDHSYYCWTGLLENDRTYLPEPFRRGYMKGLHHWPQFDGGNCPVTDEIESRMILVEVCSIDPTPEEVIQMVEKLGSAL